MPLVKKHLLRFLFKLIRVYKRTSRFLLDVNKCLLMRNILEICLLLIAN